MAVVTQAPAAFELKSAALTLVAVVLKTTDLERAGAGVRTSASATPLASSSNDPVVIDLSQCARRERRPIDFAALSHLLRGYKMLPVAVEGGQRCSRWRPRSPPAWARRHGSARGAVAGGAQHAPVVAGSEATAEAATTVAAAGPSRPPTRPAPRWSIDKPLRSGPAGLCAGARPGRAGGGQLRRRGHRRRPHPRLRAAARPAIAGARGNTDGAHLHAPAWSPQLVSIAGIYRTTENPLPADVLGKPAQVRLDGERW